MLSITSLEVQSFSLDFLDVRWQIADTSEDPTAYSFTVLRSESPAGPFEAVSLRLVNKYLFRDKTPDLYAKWRVFYYQILIRHTTTGDETFSPVSFLGLPPDREALEMARLYQLLLKVNIGVPVLVIKKRTSGPSCPVCFDKVRGRSVASDCTYCFNSRYRGGFLTPIPTFVNFTPNKKTTQIAAQTQQEPNDKTVDMTGYPMMQPGDIIIDPTNRRWRVSFVDDRSKAGFTHRQILRMKEIDRTEVVYRLPVDANLFPTREGELWPLPADFGQLQEILHGFPEEQR